MKVSIVKIGNSRGVIIPKPIRSLVGLSSDTVDLSVENNTIVLRPVNKKTKSSDKAYSRRGKR